MSSSGLKQGFRLSQHLFSFFLAFFLPAFERKSGIHNLIVTFLKQTKKTFYQFIPIVHFSKKEQKVFNIKKHGSSRFYQVVSLLNLLRFKTPSNILPEVYNQWPRSTPGAVSDLWIHLRKHSTSVLCTSICNSNWPLFSNDLLKLSNSRLSTSIKGIITCTISVGDQRT